MARYIDIANLKGPQGERGPQGLPGVNAVPADTAVATYVTDPGAATYAALGDALALQIGDDQSPAHGVLDAVTAAFAGDGTSETHAAVVAVAEGLLDERLQVGLYADRPAPESVAPATIYAPTDVPELYVSTGAQWLPFGASGQELGYAEVVPMFSTSSQAGVDVPGFTSTFVVGERPIRIDVHARTASAKLGEQTHVKILLDGVEVQRIETTHSYVNAWQSVYGGVRVGGLVPGSSHTVKVQLATNGAGPARIGGDPTLPNNLQIVTV